MSGWGMRAISTPFSLPPHRLIPSSKEEFLSVVTLTAWPWTPWLLAIRSRSPWGGQHRAQEEGLEAALKWGAGGQRSPDGGGGKVWKRSVCSAS